MSLVVAGIHEGHITVVADTKVSFYDPSGRPDERRNRDTFFEAMTKLVLLRPGLLVGVTGDDPDQVIKRMIPHGGLRVEDVLETLRGEADAAFVVAALEPLRLYTVADGKVDDRTAVGRAWAGDRRAYDLFRARSLDPVMVDADLCFRLMSSMQWLTTFDPVDTVGGTTMRVTSHADGFRFSAMFTRVGPRYMEVESATFVGGTLRVTFRVPEGVDGSTYQIIVVPGDRPTPGAVALLIPETGKGLIFTEDEPWAPKTADAASVTELAAAAEAYGQSLTTPTPPPDYW